MYLVFRSNPVSETDYHKLDRLAKKIFGRKSPSHRPTGDSENPDKDVLLRSDVVELATNQKLSYIKPVF